jgi:hypothetical protein
MITIQAKKHDNFSVEFKFGFVGNSDVSEQEFAVNTWIFVPNSLDITPQTYGKDQFYRDIKSNVRLITPVYLMRELSDPKSLPFVSLRTAFEKLASQRNSEAADNYETQIKMFTAIVKSSLRNHSVHIKTTASVGEIAPLSDDFATQARKIIEEYRRLYQLINVPTVTPELRNHYFFGDEMISHIVDVQTLRILKRIDEVEGVDLTEVRAKLVALMRDEQQYKTTMGYQTLNSGEPESNRQLVFRYGLLKKYVESDLYIHLNKKRDGFAIEQVYYSVAAGLAMIFATAVAWFAQLKYGNITGPLFVVLVVSYMLKDRIKGLMRYYFAHRLGDKYFDKKADISVGKKNVGMMKEGFDFISWAKVPQLVKDLREKASSIHDETRIFEEKILLYRKHLILDDKRLQSDEDYPMKGINEIMRLHLTRFTQKMDNPNVPVDTLDEQGNVITIQVQKSYDINIVFQLKHDGKVEYHHFRITMTRDGVLHVVEV